MKAIFPFFLCLLFSSSVLAVSTEDGTNEILYISDEPIEDDIEKPSDDVTERHIYYIEVDLDTYLNILPEIEGLKPHNESIERLGRINFILDVGKTSRRMIGSQHNYNLDGKMKSEWEQFNNNLDMMGLSGVEKGRVGVFNSELMLKQISDLAVANLFDTSIMTMVIAVGVINPFTGSLLGATYFVLVRPEITTTLTNTLSVAPIFLYQGVESIEMSIDAANLELDRLSRVSEEDWVRFLMHYLSIK